MTRLGGSVPDATALPPTPPAAEPRIKAALWFANAGFGVFPCWSALDGVCRCPKGAACGSPAKHPLSEHGFKDATTDEKRIRTFLSAASLPNYGLVCPDGVFALDVDGEGWESRLAELEARLGPLPPTLRTATRNGQHIFLRWPADLPRPMKQMFGWVTRWGSGGTSGYVIGPRSVHVSGFEYAPVGVFEIGVLPDAWARAAVQPDTSTLTIRGPIDPATVEPGHRHDFLRDQARFMAGTIRDPDALFAAVSAINEKLPVPKTADEVRRAIGDALVKYPADPVEQDPETGEVRRVFSDELGILPPTDDDTFPEPPASTAFAGLIGECVGELARGTDASMAGLLASMVSVLGAMVPAMAHARGDQTSSPFLALVGESGIGRKGTAMNRALGSARLVWPADEVNGILLDGLNSGEALVAALYEQATNRYRPAGSPVVGLVFEEEFVNMLSSRARDGSTLDGKLRIAFDGGSLSNRKAMDSKVVQPGYILPAIAAITPRELRTRLEKDSAHTGAANRWLYVPVVKRDIIPPDEPPMLPEDLNRALKAARAGSVWHQSVTAAAARMVSEYAEHVTTSSSGIAQDLVRRYGTIAVRIAMVHAAVERSNVVGVQHLERAIALTEYARRGISWVFGQTIGNRDADLLLRHLRQSGALRKHTITRHVIRDSIRQQDAVDELVRLGYARVEVVTPQGGGRVTELRATGLGVAFVPFVQGSAQPQDKTQGDVGRAPGSEHETAGRSMDVRWTNDGHPLDERDERPVAEATWHRPCSDYTNHQDHHRLEAHGWVCIRCDGGGTDR